MYIPIATVIVKYKNQIIAESRMVPQNKKVVYFDFG